ncbi:MAG: hypothetical protein EP298_10805 [Gammaproteobacteria bacterium]|nr:MAG: hypothetical protein EP298_10805 [Gammaproteobacteria bacterium]UTW42023.1 hypothetical protein KFE69_11005 [bacterium SCSIO 12844]
MTELEIVLAAIDQYIEQSNASSTKTVKNFLTYWTGGTSGVARAKELKELLERIGYETVEEESIKEDSKGKIDQEDQDEFEVIDSNVIKKKAINREHIHSFILAYIHKQKSEMKDAILACGLTTVDKINFDAFVNGNDQTDSLRAIIQYWLTLKRTLHIDQAPPSSFKGKLKQNKVKRIIATSDTPMPEVLPTEGGKQKVFDKDTGRVIARTEEVQQEFVKEAKLKEYVTENYPSLLKHMSFQTQDKLNPNSAFVSTYGFDNEDFFGFETLDKFISQAETRNYTPRQILQIIEQIFDITHQFWLAGISHQDLHSGNIKIIPDGPYDSDKTFFKVKIFDYGNAKFNPQLQKNDLLVDWSYLLRGRSATVSDEIGRSIVSYMPVDTEVNKKHYPIIKLMQLLDPTAQLKPVFNEHTEYFLNSLRYARTDDIDTLDYLYNNFKYAFFTKIAENSHIYDKSSHTKLEPKEQIDLSTSTQVSEKVELTSQNSQKDKTLPLKEKLETQQQSSIEPKVTVNLDMQSLVIQEEYRGPSQHNSLSIERIQPIETGLRKRNKSQSLSQSNPDNMFFDHEIDTQKITNSLPEFPRLKTD